MMQRNESLIYAQGVPLPDQIRRCVHLGRW